MAITNNMAAGITADIVAVINPK
ncbi:MAG: hypothetical protein RLY97_59, partial [Pseudomonadota bacterium]